MSSWVSGLDTSSYHFSAASNRHWARSVPATVRATMNSDSGSTGAPGQT